MAAKKDAEAKPAKAKDETVHMVRDAEVYPEPHEADVHPDEVENFSAGGWEKA